MDSKSARTLFPIKTEQDQKEADEFDAYMAAEQQRALDDARARWNFDFERDQPVNGKDLQYEWSEIDGPGKENEKQ